MDTDDLSNETYQAVIIEAEKFMHDLTLHFGVLVSSCKNEAEYLDKAEKLIAEIKKGISYDLEDYFFGNIPDIKELHKTLNKILKNIEAVRLIPEDKRHYEF